MFGFNYNGNHFLNVRRHFVLVLALHFQIRIHIIIFIFVTPMDKKEYFTCFLNDQLNSSYFLY